MSLVGLRMLVRSPAKVLVAWMTRSRWLGARLFGIRLCPLSNPSWYYFDITTLPLVNAASRYVNAQTRVLDLGTGAAAVIGLALWRRHGCPVIAADADRELVASAREHVALNGAPIEVVQSSFFSGVRGDVDVVTFNPPYVTTAHGVARGLNDTYRIQWDGGPDGTSVIGGFLDEVARYPRRPLVVMGVNRWHATPDLIDMLFRHRPGLTLIDVTRHPYFPVNIYVFQRTA